MPGHCLQSLARLGYPGTVELAATVLHRGDLNDARDRDHRRGARRPGTVPARELVREFIQQKTELLAEPQALRGVLKVVDASEIPDVLSRFMTRAPVARRAAGGRGFRTLMDALAIDDCGWCFRTGPSGRIELRKTIKAVESGYDCDILAAMGEATIKQIAQRFRAGDHADIVHAIADWTARRRREARRPIPTTTIPARSSAAVTAFCSSPILEASEKLGHQFQQWVVGFELSAAFAIARSMNPQLALKRARGDIDKLLKLAELETAFLLPDLPAAIAVLCRDDEARARKAQDWCLRMLEAQGPFFPKVVALETLGRAARRPLHPRGDGVPLGRELLRLRRRRAALSLMGEAIVAAGAREARGALAGPRRRAQPARAAVRSRQPRQLRGGHVQPRLVHGRGRAGIDRRMGEPLRHAGAHRSLRDWLEEDPALVGPGGAPPGRDPQREDSRRRGDPPGDRGRAASAWNPSRRPTARAADPIATAATT